MHLKIKHKQKKKKKQQEKEYICMQVRTEYNIAHQYKVLKR